MCAIYGAILPKNLPPKSQALAFAMIDFIAKSSRDRGRDGSGWIVDNGHMRFVGTKDKPHPYNDKRVTLSVLEGTTINLIGNTRAEPTTEFVEHKQAFDQQPYALGQWAIVHNGTIANDTQLRSYRHETKIDSAAIVEVLQESFPTLLDFKTHVKKLKGSYAILAAHNANTSTMFVACNYRPIWYWDSAYGVFFASSRKYFPEYASPQMIEPYTVATFDKTNRHPVKIDKTSLHDDEPIRALVVCSGGLDSVVAATVFQSQTDIEPHILHFRYGSRAEGPEGIAISKIGEFLGIDVHYIDLPFYSKKDSPLFDPDSPVAGGEEGAEFAHEWVPARNLVLLALATAYAEANGYNTLVLGNNLEEAGAYPDNEPEFIDRFNDLLPFAVGDGKKVRVVMPVGNLMKHEIVKLGNDLQAPMHLTWSCYRAGKLHCGKCGPCFMRRKAFEMNGIPEVIEYEV